MNKRTNFPVLAGSIRLESPTAADIGRTAKAFQTLFGVRPHVSISGRFGSHGAIQARVIDWGERFITLNASGPPLDPTSGIDASATFTIPPAPERGK